MRTPRARRAWPWLMAVVLLCAPVAVVAAEFIEFYKLGLSADEAGDWEQVAEMMQKAIAEQPNAKTRVTKSFFFRRYLPHFYLGKARFRSGDCAGALSSWEESERQGIVKRFAQFQEIQEGRAACRQQVDLVEARQQARELAERAQAAATESRRQLAVLAGTDDSTQGLIDRQTEAEAGLERARRRIGAADVTLNEVRRLLGVMERARTEFEAIQSAAAGQRAARIEQRERQAVDELAKVVKAARRELANSEFLRPFPSEVSRRRRELTRMLERAEAATTAELSAGELEALQSELVTATRNLRRSVAPPPEELVAAAEAYLARDYAQVLELLQDTGLGSSRAVSHVHLLRAAALFAMYEASGRDQSDLLQQAGVEAVACRTADPRRNPPSAMFSPAFVEFFDDRVRAAEAEDPSPETEGP